MAPQRNEAKASTTWRRQRWLTPITSDESSIEARTQYCNIPVRELYFIKLYVETLVVIKTS